MRQRGVPRGRREANIGPEKGHECGDTADTAWVGVDIGKTHHWVCALDAAGAVLISMKIRNDEAEILSLIATVSEQAQQLNWAVDIIGAPSALILALLAQAGQSVRYASGRVVAAMSAAYAGEGKTDAKDAYVIAEAARIRRDLRVVDRDSDLVRNLAVLTGHRSDLIANRVRMINRLRDLMTSVFPSGKGIQLQILPGRSCFVDRLRQSRPDTQTRAGPSVGKAATPPGAQLRRCGYSSGRRRPGPNDRAPRPRSGCHDHKRTGHQHPCPR